MKFFKKLFECPNLLFLNFGVIILEHTVLIQDWRDCHIEVFKE